jgi:hypothetical protein
MLFRYKLQYQMQQMPYGWFFLSPSGGRDAEKKSLAAVGAELL